MGVESNGAKIKPINAEAISMYQKGMTVEEIAKIQKRASKVIRNALKRAEKRGEALLVNKKAFNFEAERKKVSVCIGSFTKILMQETEPAVQRWLVHKVCNEEYETINHFLIDLIVEEYFAEIA